MPREIPRSRRYVTVLLPRDRDLIFRIGHNLGRHTVLLRRILPIASTLSRLVEDLSLSLSLVHVKSPGREIASTSCARDTADRLDCSRNSLPRIRARLFVG